MSVGQALRRRWRRPRRLLPTWRTVAWLLVATIGLLVLGLGGLALAAYIYWPTDLPSVKALEEYAPSLGSKVYADDDELLTEFQAERRTFVPLREIPAALRDGIIAVEDTRFYSHFGVDVRGIVRAAYANFRHGRVVEGGSTITQQLAKVLFLTPDRRFNRKIKEALLALELEKRYSKDRLLELYLNQIYLGHGSFGVEAASRTFFGKSVRELTLPEAALLAALPRAPGSYSPFEHPELAQKRRAIVLARMVELGYATAPAAEQASQAPLGLVTPERRRTPARYFLEYLQQGLEAKFGSDLLYKGGLSIYTTLNPGMQQAAERALREGLEGIAARQTARSGAARAVSPPPAVPEGAVLVLEPQTGYIKAMVGGSDFSRSEFNRAVNARRQPGSAFKPFVYVAAIEAGRTAADVIDDSPVIYTAGPGRTWAPDNYDGKFRGPVTLQQGMEDSINIVAIKLLEQVGVARVIDVSRRLGIQSPLQANLTLALGSSDVTLLELTAAYGALANQGVRMEPIAIRYVTDGQGRLIEENIPQGREALSPAAAHAITQMMRGVVERGTGVSARSLGRPIAAKTGTTNDFSNAWFVGYTPSVVTGVWVGHDRLRSLGRDETGARAALPIWLAVMREVLRDRPVEEFPLPEQTVTPGPLERPVPAPVPTASSAAAPQDRGVSSSPVAPAPAAAAPAAEGAAPAAAAAPPPGAPAAIQVTAPPAPPAPGPSPPTAAPPPIPRRPGGFPPPVLER